MRRSDITPLAITVTVDDSNSPSQPDIQVKTGESLLGILVQKVDTETSKVESQTIMCGVFNGPLLTSLILQLLETVRKQSPHPQGTMAVDMAISRYQMEHSSSMGLGELSDLFAMLAAPIDEHVN